eukprot:CAMPEP_0198110546 /NCGR_PEP_ID=MMETSP1442-20131203/2548_1 /TAXON_ID= /ORGANISM="Craspedostauros australis, Strain CCMP3328" /LENGTH=53 /DNA_ID=CAMNT_0043766653 /DNA_START=114 /DNA_END=275 /DNA_ORIENTATION=-
MKVIQAITLLVVAMVGAVSAIDEELTVAVPRRQLKTFNPAHKKAKYYPGMEGV